MTARKRTEIHARSSRNQRRDHPDELKDERARISPRHRPVTARGTGAAWSRGPRSAVSRSDDVSAPGGTIPGPAPSCSGSGARHGSTSRGSLYETRSGDPGMYTRPCDRSMGEISPAQQIHM